MYLRKRWWPVLAAVLGAVLVFLHSVSGQTPPRILTLRFIPVASDSEAAQLLRQLQSGFSFAVLACEKSLDASAADGGLMDGVDSAQLRAAMREALQGLAPGAISPVFRLPGDSAS